MTWSEYTYSEKILRDKKRFLIECLPLPNDAKRTFISILTADNQRGVGEG